MPPLAYWAPFMACAAFLAFIVADGFKKLEGSNATPVKHRQEGQSAEDWLLGPAQRPLVKLGLPELAISAVARPSSTGLGSSSAVSEWSADTPPALLADGVSHLYGILGEAATKMLFPDIVIRPDPVDIRATPKEVWDVLLDFESYSQWNPFHSNVDIVEQDGVRKGTMAVKMTVNMGPILGTIVSTETIWYVDSSRHILAYGIGSDGPSSLRVVWITTIRNNGGSLDEPHARFHSYDMIGGYPALLSRGYIEGVVHAGFSGQHAAIKARTEQLRAARSRGSNGAKANGSTAEDSKVEGGAAGRSAAAR